LITLAHFSVSSAMSLPKSAGEPASGVPPKSASLALSLESARPALVSLLSLSMMSAGVPSLAVKFIGPAEHHTGFRDWNAFRLSPFQRTRELFLLSSRVRLFVRELAPEVTPKDEITVTIAGAQSLNCQDQKHPSRGCAKSFPTDRVTPV
jgi:hypothetical protein